MDKLRRIIKEIKRETNEPLFENERTAYISVERWDNRDGTSEYVLLVRPEGVVGEVRVIAPAKCIKISKQAAEVIVDQFGTLLSPCIGPTDEKPL